MDHRHHLPSPPPPHNKKRQNSKITHIDSVRIGIVYDRHTDGNLNFFFGFRFSKKKISTNLSINYNEGPPPPPPTFSSSSTQQKKTQNSKITHIDCVRIGIVYDRHTDFEFFFFGFRFSKKKDLNDCLISLKIKTSSNRNLNMSWVR